MSFDFVYMICGDSVRVYALEMPSFSASVSDFHKVAFRNDVWLSVQGSA